MTLCCRQQPFLLLYVPSQHLSVFSRTLSKSVPYPPHTFYFWCSPVSDGRLFGFASVSTDLRSRPCSVLVLVNARHFQQKNITAENVQSHWSLSVRVIVGPLLSKTFSMMRLILTLKYKLQMWLTCTNPVTTRVH